MNRKEERAMIESMNAMEPKIDMVYKELMGNGRKGLLKEWSEHKGTITAFKWLGGGGGAAGIIAIIIQLFGG